MEINLIEMKEIWWPNDDSIIKIATHDVNTSNMKFEDGSLRLYKNLLNILFTSTPSFRIALRAACAIRTSNSARPFADQTPRLAMV